MSWQEEQAVSQQKLDSIKQARYKAAKRQRRITFNNDGNDVTHFLDEATPEAMLQIRTAGLLDTQVDTIVYNTGYCFGHVLHRTKVGASFTCKEAEFANNKVADFIKQDTDALQIVVKFCRENNIEVRWSMRMNDIHDAIPPSKGFSPVCLFPPFKKDHPELLMGSIDNEPVIPYWTSVDYGHHQVRDMVFKLNREVCENYDVDGIDLDFFRHMPYFKSVAMGGSATQQDLDKMTNLIHRIRKMADKVGQKRGRPILIAVRVPDSVGYCKASGFDIVRWMEEDLIDMLVVTGYFRLNSWETSVELGHKYGIPVYSCLSDVRQSDKEAASIRNTIEGLRGRAAVAWNSGADGIYMFNFWDTTNPIWKEIGEQRTLATVNKVYTTGARSHRPVNRFLARGDRFINTPALSPEKPEKLIQGKPVKVELNVVEDAKEAMGRGASSQFKLMLRFNKQSGLQDVTVKLNKKTLTDGSKAGEWIKELNSIAEITPPNNDLESSVWIEYAVKPDLLKKGANSIALELKSGGETKMVLLDIILRSRYLRSDGSGEWK